MAYIDTLKNGLSIVVDEMPEVESVSYDLYIPGGLICDDPSHIGACHTLSELSARGAGALDSRALSDAFEQRGIHHGEFAGGDKFGYRASLLAEHIERAFELTALMITKPSLPEDEVDDIKSILLQDIASLTDNPARWVMVELSKRFFPDPYNRPSMGTKEGLELTDIAWLRSEWENKIKPDGAVLSVAGRVTRSEVRRLAEKYLASWTGPATALPKFTALPDFGKAHIQHESAQMQIALAYPSAPFGDADFYTAKVASVILSGGMFGRLFIEVREKRGLCYSVYCRHAATRDYGFVTAYAGTTPERAHETFEVMVRELKGLKGSVTPEELERAKANVKASLILGEESAGARAGSNASDFWLGKKIRTFEEIMTEVNKVTTHSIDKYLERFPVDRYRLVTLGSKEI